MTGTIKTCLLAGAIACGIAGVSPAWAQGQTMVWTPGAPRAPATVPSPLINVMEINKVPIVARVTALAAQGATETPAAASVRKTAAIVAAVNTAIQAQIALKKLPANTPLATAGVQPATFQPRDRFGRLLFLDNLGRVTTTPTATPYMVPNGLAGYGVVNIPGVTRVFGPDGGSRDPTGEPNGLAQFAPGQMPGGGGGGTTPSPGYNGSMGGTGAMSGMSTGTDATGQSSFVSFGVLAQQGLDAGCSPGLPPTSSCPGVQVATLTPGAGRTDEEVLSDLALLFNSLFGKDGISASYDPLGDAIRLSRSLSPFETLFVQNTDPGLELTAIYQVVAEPASLALLGAGLLGLGAVARRRLA